VRNLLSVVWLHSFTHQLWQWITHGTPAPDSIRRSAVYSAITTVVWWFGESRTAKVPSTLLAWGRESILYDLFTRPGGSLAVVQLDQSFVLGPFFRLYDSTYALARQSWRHSYARTVSAAIRPRGLSLWLATVIGPPDIKESREAHSRSDALPEVGTPDDQDD
jgi:hypothetical protein